MGDLIFTLGVWKVLFGEEAEATPGSFRVVAEVPADSSWDR